MGPFETANSNLCNECSNFEQPTDQLEYGTEQNSQWDNAYGITSTNQQQAPTPNQQVIFDLSNLANFVLARAVCAVRTTTGLQPNPTKHRRNRDRVPSKLP